MSRTAKGAYPLLLEPQYFAKPWGGPSMQRWSAHVPVGSKIGEVWEVADLAETSESGAGGRAVQSVILNGALRGRTLGAAASMLPAPSALAGRLRPYPLLVKLLSSDEHLSVQVHPSPQHVREVPSARLKLESWYILDARPDAQLYLGLRSGISTADAVSSIAAGRADEVMNVERAVPGACYTLPSGIVHALGAGIVAVEIQTASDTTYRLYDWDQEYSRPKRTLHLDEARAALLPEARAVKREWDPRQASMVLADTVAYRITASILDANDTIEVPPWAALRPLTGRLDADGVTVTAGQSWVFPGLANCAVRATEPSTLLLAELR